MKIELAIERIVLDGFAPQAIDGARLRAALGAELAALLHAPPAGALRAAALPSAAGAALAPAEGVHANALGAGLARSLHGVLAAPPPSPRTRAPR